MLLVLFLLVCPLVTFKVNVVCGNKDGSCPNQEIIIINFLALSHQNETVVIRANNK